MIRVFGSGPIHSRSLLASAAMASAASAPASSSSRTAISPSLRWAQPPTILPSHQAVGPMFPDRSNSAALLPALDPTAMGWRERAWYVGEHAAALFDRSGNIGPTAWWDGRIVGGWAQRKDGEIAVRLLEDIGAEGSAAIAAQAQRLGEWIRKDPGTRITPRFRTPLERELSG